MAADRFDQHTKTPDGISLSTAVEATSPLGMSKAPQGYVIWATLGAFWFLFQMYVWGRWICGPYFVPADPGPDSISPAMQNYLFWAQVIVPLLCLTCLWYWIVTPWRRERRLNSDAMIVIATTTVWFWDFSPSYIVDQVLYNSHLFNRGSWGLYAWPGWVSPGGHLLPEPLLFVPPAYIVLVLSQVMVVCWMLRKIKERRPNTGVATFIAAIIAGLFLVDSMVEMSVLRTGLYAYPAAIRAFSLFPGSTYQFPLSEGILFGGFGLGSIAILKFFKDDRGRTFVEKGIDTLRISEARRQMLRLLAIYGWIHTAFFVLYMMPATFVAVNGDDYPKGYPSYLINGMCLYGEHHDLCPGPGISIPRPK